MPIERQQFARLILEDQHKLQAYVLARGGDHHLAEDVVQDVLALALERMESFNDADHLHAWCRETARRKQLERFRTDRRRPRALDADVLDLLEPHWAPVTATDGSEAMDALDACLAGLSPSARRVIDARYRDGMTGPKLAEAVGGKFNTVYSALSRAHAALAECIRRRLAEGGGA